jgi:hypothetical protein
MMASNSMQLVPRRKLFATRTHIAEFASRWLAPLLWRGDFQEARQMLSALGNRADRPQRRARTSTTTSIAGPAEAFHLYRQARSQRARTLNALLIPLNDDYEARRELASKPLI